MISLLGRSQWTLLLLLALAGTARAQEVVEYTVREGDTCASIARRFYGDARAYDRIHDHNPGMGAPPHRLEAGTVLRLPPATLARGPDAHVTAVRRRVSARGPRAESWAAARAGQALEGGWQVATHDASSALLTFRDDSVLEMRAQTLVVIYGGSRELARRGDARATLERGTLRSRLGELAGIVDLETPTSRAQVGSGQAVMTVDQDGTSRLANLGGRAATVTTDVGRVRVPAGTGTIVRRGEAPSAPRPLPPPPVWSNDLAGRFVGLTGRGGTLRGSWEPVPDAARYRVEIAARPDGSDVVAAVEVPGDEQSFEVHGLPPSVYYASVATIDASMLEGAPSPLRAMQVMSARIIPPGGTEPVEEPYDPGDPSRPASTPRVLPGTWVVAPIGTKCAVGEETPREMITVRAPGPTRVRCFDPADREIPGFEVLVLRVRTQIEEGARVARGETTEVRLRLEPEIPPGVALDVTAGGAEISRPRRTHDGAIVIDVTPDRTGRATTVPLSIGLFAANERIEIAATTLAVAEPVSGVDDGADTRRDASGDRDAAEALRASALVFDTLPSELAPAVRRSIPRGFALWIAASAGSRDDGYPASAGARARVFDEPLWVALSWTSRLATDAPSDEDPSGAGGTVASELAFRVSDETLSAWLSLGARASIGNTDGVVVLPSIDLDYALAPALLLRTRQGAAIDTRGATRLLYAASFAAELRLGHHFAAAFELAVSGTALEPALSLATRIGPAELALAAVLLANGHPALLGTLRGVFTR